MIAFVRLLPLVGRVQRGATSLAYWGIFSVACNAVRKNSLISYGIFFVNTLRRAICLSAVAVPAYPYNTTLFFPFRSVGGGAVVSVFKGSFAWGGRIQGFPYKYARSEARGRFIGKRRSRSTF